MGKKLCQDCEQWKRIGGTVFGKCIRAVNLKKVVDYNIPETSFIEDHECVYPEKKGVKV